MRLLIKIAILLNVLIGTIKLASMGMLSPVAAAIILVAATFILAGGRKIVVITAAALGLYFLIKTTAGNDLQLTKDLLQGFLTLFIILIGFFIMFRGLFSKRKRSH